MIYSILNIYIYIRYIVFGTVGWLAMSWKSWRLHSSRQPSVAEGSGSAIMLSSRKGSVTHILLEDVVNGWLNASEDKIPMVRDSEAGCRLGRVCFVFVAAWLSVWLEERQWPCSETSLRIFRNTHI